MKFCKSAIICAILALSCVNVANAQSLLDLLGVTSSSSNNSTTSSSSSSSTTNILTSLLEGVFSSSNITVADMAGVWTTDGPAVCFQSDNFLQKAGGIAAATAVENKLSPYYTKYGLTNSTITIQSDGTFTMTVKKMTLSGTITQESGASAGVFTFNFSALGVLSMGSVTTYVEKTSSSMSIMFDASKFKTILSSMAKLTGNSLASTAASLLDSYDGLCVGFHMNKTGNVSTTSTTTTTTTTTTDSDSDSGILGGLGSLLFGGSSTGTTTTNNSSTTTNKTTTNKTTTTTTNTNTNTNSNSSNSNSSSGLDLLKGLFGK